MPGSDPLSLFAEPVTMQCPRCSGYGCNEQKTGKAEDRCPSHYVPMDKSRSLPGVYCFVCPRCQGLGAIGTPAPPAFVKVENPTARQLCDRRKRARMKGKVLP